MSDAAWQAALARLARAPEDEDTWDALARALRGATPGPADLVAVATAFATSGRPPASEHHWVRILREAGWVAGEPSPAAPEAPWHHWALAPDARAVAAAGRTWVALWDGVGLHRERRWETAPRGEVRALALEGGQLRLLTEAPRSCWILWRGGPDQTWHPEQEWAQPGRLLAADLAGGWLAWGDRGRLRVLGPGTDRLLDPLGEGDEDGEVEAAAFVAGGDRVAGLWDLGRGGAYGSRALELAVFCLPEGGATGRRSLVGNHRFSMAFSPDGATLALAGARGERAWELRLYPVEPDGALGEVEEPAGRRSDGVVPGPGPAEVTVLGQAASRWRRGAGVTGAEPALGAGWLAVQGGATLLGREDGFDLLDQAGGELLARPAVQAAVQEAGFSPDGSRLWTCDERRVLRSWAWPSGELAWARPLWRSHALPWGGGPYLATFSPIYHEVRRAETGAVLYRLYHPEDRMVVDNWVLADVAPGGDALLLRSDTRRLRCLDAATGRSRWRRKLRGEGFGPVVYPAEGAGVLVMLRQPGRVFELAAGDGTPQREWSLPAGFPWEDPSWRLRLGAAEPVLVGPGAVRLEEDGAVTVLVEAGGGPCTVDGAGTRRARRTEAGAVVEDLQGTSWVAVTEVPLEGEPGFLLLTPEGRELLWPEGFGMRLWALPPRRD